MGSKVNNKIIVQGTETKAWAGELPEALHKTIKIVAFIDGRTQADFVTEAIYRELIRRDINPEVAPEVSTTDGIILTKPTDEQRSRFG
jgi:hypothetical protein